MQSSCVARFMGRRDLTGRGVVTVGWELDRRRCCIDGFRVEVALPRAPSAEECRILHRMFAQCPVHRALEATPVTITIAGESPDRGPAS